MTRHVLDLLDDAHTDLATAGTTQPEVEQGTLNERELHKDQLASRAAIEVFVHRLAQPDAGEAQLIHSARPQKTSSLDGGGTRWAVRSTLFTVASRDTRLIVGSSRARRETMGA